MIKGAAVAGAAAWTAPVIIDSLTSPAAAASACVKYFAKYGVRGASPCNCPGNGPGYVVTSGGTNTSNSGITFPVSGDKWGGACSGGPSGCGLVSGSVNKIASVSSPDGNGYRKVTLVAGCRFSSTSTSDWQVGGRYGTSDPGDRYIQVQGNTSTSGYGYITNEGNTAWVLDLYPTDSSRGLQYFYLQFCCTS